MLLVKSDPDSPVAMAPLLAELAECCRTSHEYQGHGWGVLYLDQGRRRLYRSLAPIWESDFGRFGDTTFLLAHARSAFRDRDIALANNMPFTDEHWAFAFNGELHGVRIREQGRIGAEKIFHFIKRFEGGDMARGFDRAIMLIRRRSARVRAMNILLTDLDRIFLCSQFDEQPSYFTLHRRQRPGQLMICSEPLPGIAGWQPVANHTIEVLQ